ncbi:MAG: hypothetical protein EZS28_052327, partial [Streblomastix strix]
ELDSLSYDVGCYAKGAKRSEDRYRKKLNSKLFESGIVISKNYIFSFEGVHKDETPLKLRNPIAKPGDKTRPTVLFPRQGSKTPQPGQSQQPQINSSRQPSPLPTITLKKKIDPISSQLNSLKMKDTNLIVNDL